MHQVDWTQEISTPEDTMNEEKRSYLSHREAFKLADWLKTNIESLHGLTYQQIADKATEGVEFQVTVANVRGAEKAAEITLPIAARVNEPAEKELTMKVRLENLESAHVWLDQRVAELERHVFKLPADVAVAEPAPSIDGTLYM